MNERIKELRKALNLTQAEFGARIGVKANTITNYETGTRSPSDAVILSICREFNVNQYWLETGNGEMFNAVDDVEKAVSFYMSALKGGTEADDNFKKVFVAELAGVLDALGPAGWQAVKQMIVNVYEAQQGEGGGKK